MFWCTFFSFHHNESLHLSRWPQWPAAMGQERQGQEGFETGLEPVAVCERNTVCLKDSEGRSCLWSFNIIHLLKWTKKVSVTHLGGDLIWGSVFSSRSYKEEEGHWTAKPAWTGFCIVALFIRKIVLGCSVRSGLQSSWKEPVAMSVISSSVAESSLRMIQSTLAITWNKHENRRQTSSEAEAMLACHYQSV